VAQSPTKDLSSPVRELTEAQFLDWVQRHNTLSDQVIEDLTREDLTAICQKLRDLISQQEARFACITEIGSALGRTFNLDELLAIVMRKITELMEAERSTLFIIDYTTGELWSRVTQGMVNTEIRMKLGEGIAGWVAHSGQSINIRDAYGDPRFNPQVDVRTGYQTRNILCQPIRNQEGSIIGVVQVLNRRNGHFTDNDEHLLSALASQAAIAIENSKLYLSVVESNIELTELAEKLEQKIAELDLLYDLERELGLALDLESLVERITQKIVRVLNANGSVLSIRERDHLRTYVHENVPAGSDGIRRRFSSHALSKDDVLFAQVIESGQPKHSNVAPPLLQDIGCLNMPVENIIAVPLLEKERTCIGALAVINHVDASRGFREGDVKILTLIASRIADAVVARRQQEELEKASRLATIGQMLSGVIHDIKNPIAIISGYVQLMERSEDGVRRREFGQTIRTQFDQLDQMTQELLYFARGESFFQPTDVPLTQFFDELRVLLEHELERRDVQLVIESKVEGSVYFDAGKMRRVIMNLARNGADAMPDGGVFSIRADRASNPDTLVMDFEDQGSGIPEEIHENIFESFVTRGKSHGTGLGLAIVKAVVDGHHGTISFESSPDRGTTFSIRLPQSRP
jgi:signal transduction histidine kinase/putative methionine-R-sulfoxide reductase with GAF domain